MSYNLNPADIQIGGVPYSINPEYWSNPGRVFRSPKETLDRINKLLIELSGLRIDVIIQVLEIFREHPNRVYTFEYESGGWWEGSTGKVDIEAASGNCLPVSFMYKGKMCQGDIYSVFVDEDGIIKFHLLQGIADAIEFGDVCDNVENILSFILGAKDYASSSYQDRQIGGVFYREER